MIQDQSLLLVLPVCFRKQDGELVFEAQAVNGLRRWSENFARVTVAAPLVETPSSEVQAPMAPLLEEIDGLEVLLLPSAYTPLPFARQFAGVSRLLAEAIDEHRYLSFAIGGLFGDWGAVACHVAHRKRRPYSVWTDRVESQVVKSLSGQGSLKARLRASLTHSPMAKLEEYVIRRSALGLFHGADTYEFYKDFSRRPELVHDIHTKPDDLIDAQTLEAKIARQSGERPLDIIYVGRADPMKGVQDWVDALTATAKAGVDFRATWYGEGSELEEAKQRIESAGLSDVVRFPGYLRNRGEVLAAIRAADLFVFCHLTKESPRNLIESLISGTPIVGYISDYAADLISKKGGGALTPLGEPEVLADKIIEIAKDSRGRADLIRAAAGDGSEFTDEAVFRHRSDLIKAHLSA